MTASVHTTPEPGANPRQLVFYTLVVVAFLAASSVPTPLYPLYQATWHFSTPMLTLAFATYLFALLLTLLFTGPLSDYLGRRPVIATALILEIGAMLCFWGAHDLTWLFIARALQGMATGIATSALGAALIDSDHRHGPILASVAPMIGMGLGALGSSVLVAEAPYPMRLVFVIMVAIFVWQSIGMRSTRESVQRRAGALAAMRPRVHIPANVLPTFLRVIPANIAAWSLGGFSLSLGPMLAKDVTGLDNAMIGGLMVCLLSTMGAVSVWRMRVLATRQILMFSGTLLPLGMSIILGSVYTHSTPLLLTGFTVAGLGFGTGFMGAMRAIMALAPAGERSSLMSVIYVVSYLSASLPALAAGLASQRYGFEPTVYGYGLYVMALSLLALAGVLSQRPQAASCN
ncbi:MFS transporter [Marinobacter bohaiensis]|uniref:MFS transporter n=1 Tax=Marinobacter bohaiensis TaxID=2201898 RepID=UPI000DAB7AE7|nr:MFS transporter [Marinobacter bohaiensis]